VVAFGGAIDSEDNMSLYAIDAETVITVDNNCAGYFTRVIYPNTCSYYNLQNADTSYSGTSYSGNPWEWMFFSKLHIIDK